MTLPFKNEKLAEFDEKVIAAAYEFIARRDRHSHPKGQSDSARRFYLDESEICECCEDIRSPSRNWPWSQMKHGRTMKHVSNLFKVDLSEVRKASRIIDSR